MMILGSFHLFFMRFDVFGGSKNTREHRRGGLWHPFLHIGMLLRLFNHFMLNYDDFRQFSLVFHVFRCIWGL